jgi:hypothetical protein
MRSPLLSLPSSVSWVIWSGLAFSAVIAAPFLVTCTDIIVFLVNSPFSNFHVTSHLCLRTSRSSNIHILLQPHPTCNTQHTMALNLNSDAATFVLENALEHKCTRHLCQLEAQWKRSQKRKPPRKCSSRSGTPSRSLRKTRKSSEQHGPRLRKRQLRR